MYYLNIYFVYIFIINKQYIKNIKIEVKKSFFRNKWRNCFEIVLELFWRSCLEKLFRRSAARNKIAIGEINKKLLLVL